MRIFEKLSTTWPLRSTGFANRSWITIAILGVIVRMPSFNDDLEPFLYCDEQIWLNEILRLRSTGSFLIGEFRSGSYVVLPIIFLVRLFEATGMTLANNNIVILARSTLISSSIIGSIFFLDRTSRILGVNAKARLIALLLFALSPSVVALNRNWYPDHTIFLPTCVLLYLAVQTMSSKRREMKQFVLLGIALATLISTKYTGIFAVLTVLPSVLVTRANDSNMKLFRLQAKRAILRLLVVAGATITTFVVLNVSVVNNFDKFYADFMMNREIYSKRSEDLLPLFFYVWHTFVSPFGLLAFFIVAVGIVALYKTSKSYFFIVWSLPLAVIALFSTSERTINRNISICIPMVTVTLAIGIHVILKKMDLSKPRSLTALFLTTAVLLPLTETVTALNRDHRPNSRAVALEWISKNPFPDSPVGVNEGCQGETLPRMAGYTAVNDPRMEMGLEYYVFDSYWQSQVFEAYNHRWEQRYFNFYQFERPAFPPALFPFESKNAPAVSGYKLLKRFDGSGGEILIFRKTK